MHVLVTIEVIRLLKEGAWTMTDDAGYVMQRAPEYDVVDVAESRALENVQNQLIERARIVNQCIVEVHYIRREGNCVTEGTIGTRYGRIDHNTGGRTRDVVSGAEVRRRGGLHKEFGARVRKQVAEVVNRPPQIALACCRRLWTVVGALALEMGATLRRASVSAWGVR